MTEKDKSTVLLQHYLKKLKLPTMLREYAQVAAICQKDRSDYATFLLRLVERELLDRDKRAAERRIKDANFPVIKTIDTYDFKAHPGASLCPSCEETKWTATRFGLQKDCLRRCPKHCLKRDKYQFGRKTQPDLASGELDVAEKGPLFCERRRGVQRSFGSSDRLLPFRSPSSVATGGNPGRVRKENRLPMAKTHTCNVRQNNRPCMVAP